MMKTGSKEWKEYYRDRYKEMTDDELVRNLSVNKYGWHTYKGWLDTGEDTRKVIKDMFNECAILINMVEQEQSRRKDV